MNNDNGKPDGEQGLYRKYNVERLNDTTGKHKDCIYFVLDLDHDKHSVAALEAYAQSCEDEFPTLAFDLRHTAAATGRKLGVPVPRSARRAIDTPRMTEMVDRFLAWKLPADFAPDAGVSFTPSKTHPDAWPIGTNLLTAVQARAMLNHVLRLGCDCPNPQQCWEPCGELGHSEEHMRVAPPEDEAAIDKAALSTGIEQPLITAAAIKGACGLGDCPTPGACEASESCIGEPATPNADAATPWPCPACGKTKNLCADGKCGAERDA